MKPIIIMCRFCCKVKKFGEFLPASPYLVQSIRDNDVDIKYATCKDCEVE